MVKLIGFYDFFSAASVKFVFQEQLGETVVSPEAGLECIKGELGAFCAEVEATTHEGNPLGELERQTAEVMSNQDLLRIFAGDRLRWVTKQGMESAAISAGLVSELEFTFTYDGRHNDALHLETTAGQVLPREVGSVESGGVTYERRGLTGEFFAGSIRLKIHEGTTIDDIQLRNEAEMEVSQNEINQKIKRGLVSLDTTDKDYERLAASVELATEKGLSVDIALLIARSEKFEKLDDFAEFKAALENALTDGHRVLDGANPEDIETKEGTLAPSYVVYWLRQHIFQRAELEEALDSLGYKSKAIKEVLDKPTSANLLNVELTEAGKREVVPAKSEKLANAVSSIVKNQSRYKTIADQIGVAWEVIGAIHYREASCDFNKYFLNGETLGKPTTKIPAGILCHTWEESVKHAVFKEDYGFTSLGMDPDPLQVANLAESYNGLGYKNKGLVSPYVWAGHPDYESQGGMYVRDGKFNRTAHDPRVGVMPIYYELRRQQEKTV